MPHSHPGLDAVMTTSAHHTVLKGFYVGSRTQAKPTQIDNRVQDQLPRPMISGFSSPSSIMNINALLLKTSFGHLEMGCLTTLTKSIDAGVLHESSQVFPMYACSKACNQQSLPNRSSQEASEGLHQQLKTASMHLSACKPPQHLLAAVRAYQELPYVCKALQVFPGQQELPRI